MPEISKQTTQKIAYFLLFYWVFLVIYTIFDITNLRDIGVVESLKQSQLARIMFQDIGALTTTFAVWIIFYFKFKLRYLLAFAVICTGSFSLLPFLAFWLLNKDKFEVPKADLN